MVSSLLSMVQKDATMNLQVLIKDLSVIDLDLSSILRVSVYISSCRETNVQSLQTTMFLNESGCKTVG